MAKVKICGVTNKEDAVLCASLGADAIGNIIGIAQSPRNIAMEKSKEIFSSLPVFTGSVAVLANKGIDFILNAVKETAPAAVQLHGSEDVEFVKLLRSKINARIIKTIHVGDKEESIKKAKIFAVYCDALLLDTSTHKLGGSGVKHDWNISKEIVKTIKKPVILAGGLTPENVKEAIKTVKPYAVDVSSGVEKEQGKKDAEKVRKFIESAKRLYQ